MKAILYFKMQAYLDCGYATHVQTHARINTHAQTHTRAHALYDRNTEEAAIPDFIFFYLTVAFGAVVEFLVIQKLIRK